VSGLGWLLVIVVVVGAFYLLTRKRRPAVVVPPKPPAEGEGEVETRTPGRFWGAYFGVPYMGEGGLHRFGTHLRELGCWPHITYTGIEPNGTEPYEVNITVTHRKTGKRSAIYLDGTGLRSDDRWTDENLFAIYPMTERPGQGKPTSCNPQIQALYDAAWAAQREAQAVLDLQLDPLPPSAPINTPPPGAVGAPAAAKEKAACGTGDCHVLLASQAEVPEGCEWLDFDFRFRSQANHDIVSHWRQSIAMLPKTCNPAPAK